MRILLHANKQMATFIKLISGEFPFSTFKQTPKFFDITHEQKYSPLVQKRSWYIIVIIILTLQRTTNCRQKRLFSFLLTECTETEMLVEMVATKILKIY